MRGGSWWAALGWLAFSACNCGATPGRVASTVTAPCETDEDCLPGLACAGGACRPRVCEDGASLPCGHSEVGLCRLGAITCDHGQWGVCAGAVEPAPEACDGADNDCDGAVDEDFDLLDDPAHCGGCDQRCQFPHASAVCRAGRCELGTCETGWFDVDAVPDDGCEYRCDPDANAVEVCDGRDNDCDGAVDEGFDRDGDGFTICGGDCDDALASVHPGALEQCNGRDDDCDGQVDQGFDQDGDGFTLCGGDCDDFDPGTYPGAAERCDAADNDCDGRIDEELGTTTCGKGLCQRTVDNCAGGVPQACEPGLPGDEVCDGLDDDCDGETDEALGTITCGKGLCQRTVDSCVGGVPQACEPGLPGDEVCDGLDDDCDGETDEGLGTTTCGKGLCQRTVDNCAGGIPQACEPGRPEGEVCDGLDDDCDGETDEEVTVYTQDGSSQRVDPVLRPMDIVFVVANNGTMSEEIEAVEANINQSFAALIEHSGIDYRVIMLSRYGYGASTGNYALCVQPPLGGNETCDGTCPVNTDRLFHYSVDIGAHDSLSQIIATYAAPDPCGQAPGGWSQWLRPGAIKVFVEISDSGPTTGSPDGDNAFTADTFEAFLFALDPSAFGTPESRTYLFHSVVGLAENEPPLAPWLPDAPLVDARCTGNGGYVQQPGLAYQELSVRTGGLRYPICQYQSFDAVFAEIARGIVERSELSCEFAVSSVPADSSLDNTLLELVSDDESARVPLAHVAGTAECSGDAFYVEHGTIRLCPDACTLWRSNPTSTAEVSFTCRRQVP